MPGVLRRGRIELMRVILWACVVTGWAMPPAWAEDAPPLTPAPEPEAAAEPEPAPAPVEGDEVPRPRFGFSPGTEGPSGENPAAATPPASGGARRSANFRLNNGQDVSGEIMAETADGWAVKLPSGETRFYDRLDISSEDVPQEARPSLGQKAVLLASVGWPGIGQVLYGLVAQRGVFYERSGVIVGSILAAVTAAGLLLVGVGITSGLLMPAQLSVQLGRFSSEEPLLAPLTAVVNPVTVAGLAAMFLSLCVGLADGAARLILD